MSSGSRRTLVLLRCVFEIWVIIKGGTSSFFLLIFFLFFFIVFLCFVFLFCLVLVIWPYCFCIGCFLFIICINESLTLPFKIKKKHFLSWISSPLASKFVAAVPTATDVGILPAALLTSAHRRPLLLFLHSLLHL